MFPYFDNCRNIKLNFKGPARTAGANGKLQPLARLCYALPLSLFIHTTPAPGGAPATCRFGSRSLSTYSGGTCLVIPCFNEAGRLDPLEVADLLRSRNDLGLLLVDDGSTDGTPRLFADLRSRHPEQLDVMRLPVNQGKGEAVRQGMLRAIEGGATVTGYADADFATPASEILRLLGLLQQSGASAVFGSRLLNPGAGIQRSGGRQFMGAAFASLARRIVGLPIADTQCGAKWFRVDGVLAAVLARPFISRWAFDVELLARLHHTQGGWAAEAFVEEPLDTWTEIPGSKLTVSAKLVALSALLAIWRDVRGLRNARRRTVPK